ncbi:sensor histidine kinase [Leptospira sp. 'Mane']|uniref:sensor histidine kinase n=1 Tax=Leptospira sp. 'Mane' TaxID=3387407 RepID=UPI00398A6D5F
MTKSLKPDWLRRLIYSGATDDLDFELILRLQITNFASIFGVASNITYSILFVLWGLPGGIALPLINLGSIFFIGLPVYLNHIRKYNLAKFVLLIALSVDSFAATDLFFGDLLGGHYYFLIFALIPFVIFPYEAKITSVFFFLINLLLFFYIEYFAKPPFLITDGPFHSVVIQNFFRILSISICYLGIATVMLYFLRNTFRNQSELQKTNAYKDKMFSILAHDLKGPMGSMGTFLGILIDSMDKIPSDEMRKGLKELRKNSFQSYVILENLLDWVKNDSHRIHFLPDYISISTIVTATIELLQMQSTEKNIQWKLSLPIQHLPYADERMTATIMRNIISNSVKFSNHSGHVIVTSQENDNEFEISVEDFGIGISSEKLQKIRNKLQPGSTFGTAGEKGTGIGLLLAIDLIAQQNGRYILYSEGKGTKFTFFLPKSP